MKTCRDCVNYAKCVENCNTYHASRLTPDSDVSDRCEHFQPKATAVNTVVYCKDCKYYSVDNVLLENVCARLFTMFPMNEYDFCSCGEHKEKGEKIWIK